MVAVRCFVWPLGLRLWSVSEADEISSFGDLKKILYPVTSKCFLVFNAVFHVRWTNIIAQRWFLLCKMPLG